MKIRKKVRTTDCRTCELLIRSDETDVCGFGKSKAKKILVPPKGQKKNCKLVKMGEVE
jgi:hypothetical protein